MAKTIKPADLGAAIEKELTFYHEDVIKRVNSLSEDAAKDLVKKTKATAPVASGSFKRHISSKLLSQNRLGNKVFVWYVRPPDHRLTHLIVHGHAGNNHRGNPFLHKAWDQVRTEYENNVAEELRK